MIIEKRWLHEVNQLIWGSASRPSDEVFLRWQQGFLFSEAEPTALVQHHGGPCAIITAVQAAILRHILFKLKYENPNDLNEDELLDVFHAALLEIFCLVSADNRFYLCSCGQDDDVDVDRGDDEVEAGTATNANVTHRQSPSNDAVENAAVEASEDSAPEAASRSPFAHFLSHLNYEVLTSREELSACLLSLLPDWQCKYGLLSFLYSVVLTHGVQNIRESMADDSDQSLVDPTFGQGSQSLLSLLIVGIATPHVFDGDKDLGGIVMRGVPQQPMTGFLTLLESLRYIEVGWYLKNPQYPVWVLGSETHLTVLFSRLEGLIQHPECDALSRAERAFYGLQGPGAEGFIQVDRLATLMETLELVTESEYVDLIRSRLDPEELGIVLLNDFLKEFYAPEIELRDKERAALREFSLFHYNGLVRPGEKESSIHYREGKARLYMADADGFMELIPGAENDSSPIRRVLQTKWPGLGIDWKDSSAPGI